MALIQVKLIEGVFSEWQKRRIVQKLTEAMIAIQGEDLRPLTWVTVEEINCGEWGRGGIPATPDP
jgi:4-oxalocrotonate tautomerase